MSLTLRSKLETLNNRSLNYKELKQIVHPVQTEETNFFSEEVLMPCLPKTTMASMFVLRVIESSPLRTCSRSKGSIYITIHRIQVRGSRCLKETQMIALIESVKVLKIATKSTKTLIILNYFNNNFQLSKS